MSQRVRWVSPVRQAGPEQVEQEKPPAVAIGNQALARLMSGQDAPPAIAAHDHTDEQATHALAGEVMRMAAPAGQRAAGKAATGAGGAAGGLDAQTRAFFEPRFGMDLGGVQVHEGSVAAGSAQRFGAAAYTVGSDVVLGEGQRAGINDVTAHELAHVVRGDAGGRLMRAPLPQAGGFTVISQMWRVGGRDIVLVWTGFGDQVTAFYRRTGLGNKGVGVAPEPGSWAPFKSLSSQAKKPDKPWFNKKSYYTQVDPENELRGYGNARNRDVGNWLDQQNLPEATEAADWQVVEQEMDRTAGEFRATLGGGPTNGGGGPGGGGGEGGGGHEPGPDPDMGGARADDAEAKLLGAEPLDADALEAEGRALDAEGKGMKVEEVLAEGAADVAKAGKFARLGSLLVELGLPGPFDVLMLYLGAFASIAEAKAKLRADSYSLGFAEGLAAVLTGTSAGAAQQMLMYKTIDPSVGERVAGFEGVRERGNNEGVARGFKFGQALSLEQMKGFLGTCFKQLKTAGGSITGDFGLDDLIEIGVALRPTVVELIEEAERQEAARKDFARRERKDYVGHNI